MLPYDPYIESYFVQNADFSQSTMNLDSMWRAIRKLSSENARIVAHNLILNPGSSFGDLRKLTGLKTGDLNHTLNDMKVLELIIYDKNKKIYYLTHYCIALISSLNHFMQTLKDEIPIKKYDIDRDISLQ